MLRRAVPAPAVLGIVLPALMAASLLAGARAGATPIDDKRAEAAQLQRQLDAMNTRISALDEQYNQAQLRAGKADAAVTQARSRLAATSQKLAGAKDGLAEQAIDAYVRADVDLAGRRARARVRDRGRGR